MAIACLWAIFVYETIKTQREVIQSASAVNYNLSRSLEAHVRRTLDTIKLVMVHTADLGHHEGLTAPPLADEMTERLAKFIRLTPQIAGLAIVETNGIARQGVEQFENGTTQVLGHRFDSTDREYFTTFANGTAKDFFLGSPIKTKTSNRWAVPMSLPIRDGDRNLIGVVVSIVTLDTFNEIFDSIRSDDSHVVLSHWDGTIMVHAPENPELVGTQIEGGILPDDWQTVAIGERSKTTFAIRHAKQYLMTSYIFPNLPIALSVGTSRDAILSDWRGDVQLHFVIGVLGSLLIIVLTTLLWRQLLANDRSRQELYEAGKIAEEASKAKSQFLANMSHELRTPLNAIIGFSETLKEQILGPLSDHQKEYVTDIHGAGRHLLSLINDVLDLSKVEAGEMSIELHDIDVRTEILEVVALHSPVAEKANVTVHVNVSDDIPVIKSDQRSFHQMLLNLLSNAIKYSASGSSVTISAAASNDSLDISIMDSGIGIPPEMRERILEPFVQIEGPMRAHKHPGTGLGLSITRSLIELHGGSISIDGNEGPGTCVTLHFPLT